MSDTDLDAITKQRDTAIGVLHRMGFCRCGHPHRKGLVCISCSCDDAEPMTYEEIAKRIEDLATGAKV